MVKLYKAKYLSLRNSTVTGETGEQQSNVSAVWEASKHVCACVHPERCEWRKLDEMEMVGWIHKDKLKEVC